MTRTETNPDEDRLRLPARWRRHVPPRRGRDLVNTSGPAEPDPNASAAVAQRIAAMRPLLEEGIERQSAPFAPSATAHLQGRPDPSGAAALMHVLESTGKQTVDPAARLRHLDAWVTDHGLAFAAVAVLESALVYNGTYADGDRSITGASLGTYLDWNQPKGWRHAQPALQRLRAFLAAATEDEYQEVVAAISARRTDPPRIIGSALLLPTEAAWVEEAVTAQTGYFEERRGDDWMVWCAAADPEQWQLALRRGVNDEGVSERGLAPLIEGVGTDVLPILIQILDRRYARLSKPSRAALLTAVGLLPADEAVGHLIDRLELPGALNAVTETAGHSPVRTLRVIAARAETAEPAARERLAGLVKSSPALADALARADEATRRSIAALVAAPDELPDAPAGALPPLLVDPPWQRKRRKEERPVIEGLAPTLDTRLVWDDSEDERRWATLREDDPYTTYNEKQEARVLEYLEEHDGFRDGAVLFAWARIEFAEALLDRWDGTAPYTGIAELQRLLGRFGPRVADRVVGLVKGRTVLAEALMPIRGLAAARLAADWLTRSKSMAPTAKRWFARHTAAAAHLLVPDTLGTDAALRRAATTALRHLITVHSAETVANEAKAYGDGAAAAIDALIAADPLDTLDAKIPKPPAWAAPSMLPQLLLNGREAALPAASVAHVTTVLALDSPELPYAGIEVVAEACDKASLTRFSWTLFELWTAVGAPAKDGWAFTQLARFADENTVAELTGLIQLWPGDGQHKRAVTGLEVLGAIGTETSLRALHLISRKVRFKALKQEAGRQIETVAGRLGLTAEELADRLVPDFGLGDDLSLVLDYGPRWFTVGFDERLQPFVTGEDGKPLKTLPKPNAEDEAETADAAYQRFAQLKKDLRTVAKEQVRRLERAMAAGRSWSVPEFMEFFVDHPLMRHLARRLVWHYESEEDAFGFRIAEDETFTDVEDDQCAFLSNGARIRLAHPVALGDRLADWSQLFADYEILQPFPQLARPVLAFTDEELRTGRLTRFEGAVLAVDRVFSLTHSGWRRGPADGLWVSRGLHYPLPGGGFVVLDLDPGIDGYLGRIDPSQPDQTIREARLAAVPDKEAQEGDHPTDIDPVAASEVLRTLTRATAP